MNVCDNSSEMGIWTKQNNATMTNRWIARTTDFGPTINDVDNMVSYVRRVRLWI